MGEKIKVVNTKGFALTELVVILVVIGILTALAVPKIGQLKKKADITKIQNDTKTLHSIVIMDSAMNNKSYLTTEYSGGVEKLLQKGLVYRNGVLLKDDEVITEKKLYLVDDFYVERNISSKLSPFYVDEKDNIYFGYDGELNLDKVESSTINVTHTEGNAIDDSKFQWVKSNNGYTAQNEIGQGYYKYIGNEEEVIIPEYINGHKITSYNRMFIDYNERQPLKVISKNTDITDMSMMFWNTQVTSLDVSELDTRSVTDMNGMFWNNQSGVIRGLENYKTNNVTDMKYMFYNVQAVSLNLSSFDTGNVVDMNSMFKGIQASKLNLLSFNTDKVVDMEEMFADSRVKELDLSSFNTRSLISIQSMFKGSDAISGYAKTQTDVDRFNYSENKPNNLFFTIK